MIKKAVSVAQRLAFGSAPTDVPPSLDAIALTRLDGSPLETEQTLGSCLDTANCPSGSICVDGACWADGQSNPTFASHTFPAADECAFVSVVDRGDRPIFLEVTDNGINDFDIDVEYRFSVTVRCGCPPACNRGAGNCQGAPAPR